MQTEVKSPVLAAILSFLLNGLGQIYNGQIRKGLIILGVQIINGLLMTVFIGFITGPIVFIYSLPDRNNVLGKEGSERGYAKE